MIVGIVQARVNSTRYPAKIFEPVVGTPMLELILRRCSGSKLMDKLVVATTVEEADNYTEREVKRWGYEVFRGSQADVLGRFYQCGKWLRLEAGDIVVRITADDPLKDPELIDDLVQELLNHPDLDYCSSLHPETTYPEGLGCEAMRFRALERANEEAILIHFREHVTAYMYRNPGIFRCKSLKYREDLHEWRWTVDTPRDMKAMNRMLTDFAAQGVSVMAGYEELIAAEKERRGETVRKRTAVS